MRRQTQWALGGVLAGTVLLGATGTLAAFSDTEQVGATAGAGSLSLTVTPVVEPGAPGAETTLRAVMTGRGQAALSMTVLGAPGSDPCAGLPTRTVAVDVPLDTDEPEPVSLCDLVDREIDVAVLSDALPTADVLVSVTAGSGGGADVTVRFTLEQLPGGFSDRVDVPVPLGSDAVPVPAEGAEELVAGEQGAPAAGEPPPGDPPAGDPPAGDPPTAGPAVEGRPAADASAG